jgi:hypothetical protein
MSERAQTARDLTNAIHRVGRRSSTLQKGRTGGSPNTFKVTVAVSPSAEISIERELELTKSALLYADEVTLCSPTSTLLTSVAALANLNDDQKLAFLEEVAPIIRPDFVLGAGQLRQFINKRPQGGREFLLKLQLTRELNTIWAELEQKAMEILEGAGAQELEPAMRRGLVRLDLLSAKYTTENMAAGYIERLQHYLQDSTTYPLFDDATGSLISAGREAGIFLVPPEAERRATQVGLASGLIAELPTFPTAPMDRILEARKEVEDHVARFRRAINELRRYLSTTALEEGFKEEVTELYAREVQAAMEEIAAILKAPHFTRTVLGISLRSAPAPGVLGLAVSSVAHLDALVGGLIGGVGVLLSAAYNLSEQKHQREAEASRHDLYLLHRANQALK